MEIFSSLFTILIIVFAGGISRISGIFKEKDAKTLSSFVYYFGLPTLFFGKISALDVRQLDPQLVLGMLGPTALILIILLAAKLVGFLEKDPFILLGLSISFGSYAFFGVAFFETFQGGRWFESAILAASLLGLLGIITTIILFEYVSRKRKGWGLVSKIFSNPLMLSILLGMLSSLLQVRIPALNSAFDLVGQTASGTAIFVLGMFIHDRFSPAIIHRAFRYSLFRMTALPLAALLITGIFLPEAGELGQFIMLENGMPAAIALVVFAERYEYKVAETAGIVSLTSLFSFLTLTAVYYLSRSLFQG